MPAPSTKWSLPRRGRRLLVALLALVAIALVTHGLVHAFTGMTPPVVSVPSVALGDDEGGIRRLGPSYTRFRGGIREVYLEGSPEQIGDARVRLLLDRMIADEQDLWNDFDRFVPSSLLRAVVQDIGLVRYRHLDRGIPLPRARELAAQARGFVPDPFAPRMPTYQRMVMLHGVYDIALSFEHSPLIGCSSFGLGPTMTADGHALLGRAFDFEADPVFDRDKVVYLVKEEGAIPFASVAWPGLAGVVSGMNLEGVAIVVHGGRASDPRAEGLPVVFSLREVLERARDTDEAVAILKTQPIMVSHLVMVGDARGRFAVVERAPEREPFVRTSEATIALTNHFEGPMKDDERNLTVLRTSTTLARRARLDELLAGMRPHEANVEAAVRILRDHSCAAGIPCALGDRRAIDALIATHGIVADTTARALWVSAGPALSGKFVRFDLPAELADGHDPHSDPPPDVIAEDPILADGRYAAARTRASTSPSRGEAR